MSLARKAARGALWTIVTSIGGRSIGVIGTLVITRFLDPSIVGEVSVAAIVCYTTNWFTTWGFGIYAMVNGRGAAATEVTWHAVVAHLGLGAVGFVLIALVGGRLMPMLDAPHAAVYVPGMALAVFIRRVGFIPDRVLLRSMRFRAVGLSNLFGEVSYTVAALGFAIAGRGGMSIVYANIIQSLVMVSISLAAAGWWSWATPTRLSLARFRDMIRVGIPLSIASIAHGGSRYWDNLAVSWCFGPAAAGTYNMAYNLADIPATQIGEQIAGVLLPSLAELPAHARAGAVERASALLSLILFPLAVGLGLVAYPLISLILPANRWQEVAPLLAILTSLSVFRPFTYVLDAYMQAQQRTSRLMFLEIGKLIVLIGGIVLLSRFGLRVAAAAVGVSFGSNAIIAALLMRREGLASRKLLLGFVQPLAACAVMALAVLAVDRGLGASSSAATHLVVAIVVGAIAYVLAALVVCRATARDLLRLLRGCVSRDDARTGTALALRMRHDEQDRAPRTPRVQRRLHDAPFR